MQNRFMGSNLAGLILAMVAVLALAPVMLAQTTQQSGTAPPDLSGVWTQTGRHPSGRFTKEEPPLQPWAMEIYKRNRAGVDPNDTARDDLDPSTFCFPPGPTRAMVGGLFQLIQFPEEVLLLFEGDSTRRIYMDGREHPEGWPFGWMGHSIGKWDGDTLVVDTVGLNDRTRLDRAGTPHSDQLHIVERFRRVDHDTLEVEFRFEDPKAFTKLWGAKNVYRPGPEILESIKCEEHLEIGKYKAVQRYPGQEQ